MKNLLPFFCKRPFYLLVFSFINTFNLFSQTTNLGFENCDFSGWVGTHSGPDTTTGSTICAPGTGPGTPIPCIVQTPTNGGLYPDPFRMKGLSIGTVNQASNVTPENSHFIMNSGYDPIVNNNSIPVVCPWSTTCSARLGNAQANGGGESMMYKFVVNAVDTIFTYNYALVLSDGSHGRGQQPYFKVRMYLYDSFGDSASIDEAIFDVDPNTANDIGGFNKSDPGTNAIWKTWTAVNIPLSNFVGKTVSVQFITRDCCPDCDSTGHGTAGGSHFAYVYLDAGVSQKETCNPPIAPVASNKTICKSDTALLSAKGKGTLSWYNSTGNYIGGGANYTTPVLDTTTTYYVQDSTCRASVNRTKVVVNINSPVVGARASADTICQNGMITLIGSGAKTYTWTGGIKDRAPSLLSATSTFTVLGTDANGCSGSDTITVFVNNFTAPTVKANYNANTICEDNTIILTGSGANSYSWDNGVPDGVGFAATVTKTFTVFGYDGNNCSGFDTVTIYVNPRPKVTASVDHYKVCAGNSVVLTASGADNYTWSHGVIDGLSFVPTISANYTVTGTDLNSCIDTYTVNVGVDPLPTVTANVSSGTVCAGSSVVLTGSGAVSYTWTGGVTDGVSFVPTSTANYTVTGIDSNNCSDIYKIKVNVSSLVGPTVVANSNTTTICMGEMVILTGSGASSYSWTGGIMDGVSFTPSSTKKYIVTGSDSSGCSNTDAITIYVNSLPNVLAKASAKTLCAGNSVMLTGSGAISYTWTDGVIDGMAFIPTATATYTLTGTNANSCFNTAEITINVNASPDVSTNTNGNTITANQIGVLYKWLDCNNNFATINGEINQSFIPRDSGSYAVSLNNKGCKDTSVCISATIPNCFSYYTVRFDSTYNTFWIKEDPLTSSQAQKYNWDFGDGTHTTNRYFSHAYQKDSVYNLCLTINTSTNDSCTYCHKIGKDDQGNVYRTSGFTIATKQQVQTGVLSENWNENSFVVYPNPTSGIFNLQMSQNIKTQIKIYNVNSECIYQNSMTTLNCSIDLSTQPEGIYFMQLSTEQGSINKKIVVSH